MALPPLPENNTDRLFITYQTGGGATSQEHTLSVRFDAGVATPFDIMSDLGEILTDEAHQDGFFDGWRVLSAEVQAQGSQVRLPVAVPANLLAFVGAGQATATPSEQAREVRYIGRGLASGRRVSMSIYGFASTQIAEQDFRFTPALGTPIGDIGQYARGLGLTTAAFTTIAGDQTNWYTYVNWQYNSHWEGEQRA